MKLTAVIRTFAFCLIGFVIFVLTLEAGGWLLLRAGFRLKGQGPSYSINSWNDVESIARNSGRISDLAKILLEWKAKHAFLNNPAVVDLKLKAELPLYSNRGLRTERQLFSGQSKLSAGLDDIYILKGALSGKEKYRAHYITDSFSRRITGTEARANARANIVFMGCSFTFGEGVNQEEIFPARVGKLIPDARVYNLGVPGTSPSSLYYRMLRDENFAGSDIDSRLPTIVVFTFIDDHMRRTIGTSTYVSRGDYAYENEPYVYLDNGKLKADEAFASRWSSLRWLYRLLGQSNIFQATNLEIPFYEDEDYRLVAVIFREMREKLKDRFPRLQFYVSFYPGNNFYASRLKYHFAQESVGTLDYSAFNYFQLANGHETNGTDSHPSWVAHELYSLFLHYDLSRI